MHESEKHLASLSNALENSRLSRRRLLKRSAIFGLSAPVIGSLLAACGGDDEEPAEESEPTTEAPAGQATDEPEDEAEPTDEPQDEGDPTEGSETEETPGGEAEDAPDASDEERYGGELRIAIRNEPPTFDFHLTSSTETLHVVMHMFETLFTWDEEFQLIPELVDTHEVSDDGLLNTLNLRQGVLFHDGSELTAEDVVASIDRWANVIGVGFGEQLMSATNEMRVVDDYTIEFEMSESFGTFGVVLARQNNGCNIYPKEVAEAAGKDPIEELIGTGPYRFVEYEPDSHFLMERFEDYVYRDEPSNGYGGRKHAYVDSIRFIPVTDEAARVSGLRAGDYDFSTDTSSDQLEPLQGDENVVAEVGPTNSNDQILLNMDQGIMLDINMRRAVQAAVNCEEILLAAHGDGFYELNPGLMWQETVWHSTAGEDLYNIGDLDLARQYLEDAGYDGEEVRILVSQEWLPSYNTAVILQQQLEDAGMVVNLQAVDAPSYGDTRSDTSAWEITITFFNFRTDPAQLPTMRCEWGNLWCSDAKVETVGRLFSEVEFDDRLEAGIDLQELIYEEVPAIKTGDGRPLLAYAARLQNVELVRFGYAFWNMWLEN